MKTDIHPKYFDKAEIRCSCGNIIVAGSTRESLKTELCGKCHPFYTGQQKLIDTAGRVDKFEAKRKKAQSIKEEEKRRKEEKKKPKVYEEKVVPQETIERVQAKEKSKWGEPLGETFASETVKEEIAEAKKAKSAKKTAAAKTKTAKSAKKTAVKKTSVKKTKKSK